MIHSDTVSTEWSSKVTATGGQTRQKKSLAQKKIDLASARRTARTAPATAMDDMACLLNWKVGEARSPQREVSVREREIDRERDGEERAAKKS